MTYSRIWHALHYGGGGGGGGVVKGPVAFAVVVCELKAGPFFVCSKTGNVCIHFLLIVLAM